MSDTDRDKLVQIIDTWLTDPDVPPSDRLADAILAEFLPEHDKRVWDEAVRSAHKRLSERVDDDGLIDELVLIHRPRNPYERES